MCLQRLRLIAGSGQCAACRYVVGLRSGERACFGSRARGITLAIRNQRPAPFICHVGFACIVAPLILGEESGTLTFGPYCPAEAPDALESDFIDGLAAIGKPGLTRSPVPLHDVRIVPVSAIPAIAEWAVEKILRLWQEVKSRSAEPPPEEHAEQPRQRKTKPQLRGQSRFVSSDPYQANTIAAALAGGKKSQAQALRARRCRKTKSTKTAIFQKRARAIALCAAVIEACENAVSRQEDDLRTISRNGRASAVGTKRTSIAVGNNEIFEGYCPISFPSSRASVIPAKAGIQAVQQAAHFGMHGFPLSRE